MAIDFKKLVKGLFIKDSSDPSKGLKLEIDPAAATNTTTTILAEQQANVTLSLPGETSELVGDVANQTLQNKTIDAANNNIVGLTDAEISATAAIDASKLADGSVSNVEFQYLGNVTSDIQTQLNTGATNLTNHLNDTTDAHDASAISNVPSGNLSATDQQSANNELQSDIDTRLLKAGDTMSGNLNMGSNLITALGTPVSGTDAANKNYVDGIAAGLDPKESVRVATTASVGGSYATTPSNGRFTGAATTIDGVALSTNDRVLIKDQADAKQNGIYVYDGAGQFTRSADMDGSPSSEVSGGNFVFVAQGTTNGASGYVLVASGIVTLNTDNLNFTQFSGGANSANKTLSNLDAPTSINQDLLPSSNNSKSLGSSSLNYQNAYITTLKDNAGVDSHAVSSRILKDSAGSNSIDYSNTSEVSFNSKKLNSLGSAAGLNYATTKQNVQEYIKNLIPDGDAEGANIISVYNDSSTTRPVDGTGGTQANLAATITSTNPLSGTNSFLLTKSGSASTQGSGFSIPFTVPIGQQAKVLQIDIDYIVNSGTFVAGSSTTESDMIVYLYDVTNSTLIEPSSIKFLSNSSTISDKFTANFQTSATGTSYRLILHCQSVSTANYALKCEFSVKPCNYVYGTPISDWKSATFTGSWVANTTYSGLKRRVGDEYEYMVKLALSGAPTSTNLNINLPSGDTIDTTKITSTTQYASAFESSGNASASGSGYALKALYNSTTSVGIVYISNGTTSVESLVTQAAPFTWANGHEINVRFSLPIVGLSSSVQQSDGYDGRQITFKATTVPGTIATSAGVWTTLTWSSADYDDISGFNGSDTYTVRTSGTYELQLLASTNAATGSYLDVGYRIDGGSDVIIGRSIGVSGSVSAVTTGTTQIKLNAGQTIQFRAQTGDTSGINLRRTTLKKLASPQTVSATEVVAASYIVDGGGQSLTSTAVLQFNTKVFDTHNAVTTGASWKFTAPYQGIYRLSYKMMQVNNTGTSCQIAMRKNAAPIYRSQPAAIVNGPSTVVSNQMMQADSVLFSLNSGEYIDVYINSAAASGSVYTATSDSWINIERIK